MTKFAVAALIIGLASGVMGIDEASAQARTEYFMRKPLAKLNTSAASASWEYGDYGAYSSSCSGAATRTRSATCVQSGRTVDDSMCTEARQVTETTSVSSGCTSVVTNGTFESGSTAPWNGGRIFGGSSNYGAGGSKFIIGVQPGGSTYQVVSGLDAGQTYVLRYSCQDHNGYRVNGTAAVGSHSASVQCPGGWGSMSLTFVASSASETIMFRNNGSTYMDIDSISIALP